jgi:hypothetical protein
MIIINYYIINIILKWILDTGWDGMDWIDLAQDID